MALDSKEGLLQTLQELSSQQVRSAECAWGEQSLLSGADAQPAEGAYCGGLSLFCPVPRSGLPHVQAQSKSLSPALIPFSRGALVTDVSCARQGGQFQAQLRVSDFCQLCPSQVLISGQLIRSGSDMIIYQMLQIEPCLMQHASCALPPTTVFPIV